MVEVFKTDVKYQEEASKIIALIGRNFDEYEANFDLEDCDKILRVCSKTRKIEAELIIKLVRNTGFNARILDEDAGFSTSRFYDVKSDLIILTTSLSFLIL